MVDNGLVYWYTNLTIYVP